MNIEKRLIEIYRESSNFFYSNIQNTTQKSQHWKRYNLVDFTEENLKNFRNDSKLSRFLDDQTDIFPFKIYAKIIDKISEEYVLKNLPNKNIGNSNLLIPYKKIYVDYNKLIHIYWFWLLENKVLKKNKVNIICEIGGGFGSLAELFLKNYNVKFILIDLPEANLMSAYYLKEFFPDKKFYLFNDYKKSKNFLSRLDFEKSDIIILPPNCNIDKKIKIDFFINARSMMEMNFDIVKSYFSFIHNYIRDYGYFLNINRYEKTSVGHPIRISEYPYDKYWKVLISEPSFNQNWIHFLFTQRTFKKNETNIIRELNNIKKIGKKFYGKYKDNNPNPVTINLKSFLKKYLKFLLGVKILNYIGNFFLKIGNQLKNVK